MRRTLSSFVLAFVVLCAAAASAVTPSSPPDEYLQALSAADAFAWAWSRRDATLGLSTLTPALRAQPDAREFFVGTSSPRHFAFEIGRGRRIGAKTYRFGVALFTYLAGGGLDQSTKPVSLTLTRAPDGAWYVAALPLLAP